MLRLAAHAVPLQPRFSVGLCRVWQEYEVPLARGPILQVGINVVLCHSRSWIFMDLLDSLLNSAIIQLEHNMSRPVCQSNLQSGFQTAVAPECH